MLPLIVHILQHSRWRALFRPIPQRHPPPRSRHLRRDIGLKDEVGR